MYRKYDGFNDHRVYFSINRGGLYEVTFSNFTVAQLNLCRICSWSFWYHFFLNRMKTQKVPPFLVFWVWRVQRRSKTDDALYYICHNFVIFQDILIIFMATFMLFLLELIVNINEIHWIQGLPWKLRNMVFFVWENGEKGIPTPQIEKKQTL